MEVLVYLADHAGEILTLNQITEAVWHKDYRGESPVYRSVNKIREALGDTVESSKFIRNVRQRGYVLLVHPEPVGKPLRAIMSAAVAAVVVVAALLVLALGNPLQPPGADTRSLAVLPFASMGSAPSTENFGDGLAQELQLRLSQIDTLNVTPQRNAAVFKNTDTPLSQISQLLKVQFILRGTILQNGDELIVNAYLLDPGAGDTLWTESFNRSSSEIFSVLEEIAVSVASALPMDELDSVAIQALAARPTQKPVTFSYYLNGLSYLHGLRDTGRLEYAEELFRRAISEDPQFARAHAALCQTHLQQSIASRSTDYFERAERHCHRAITLDAELPEAKIALSMLYRESGQYELAKQTLRTVLKNDQRNVEALVELGDAYLATGNNAQAERHYKEAIRINPADYSAQTALGVYYFRRKVFPLAAGHLLLVADLRPDSGRAHSNLAMAYWTLGRMDEAEAAFGEALQLEPSRNPYNNRGLFFFYQGDFRSSVEDFRNALAYAENDPEIYGHLGDAMRYLPADEAEILETYGTAIALAEERLKVNNNDPEVLVQLAKHKAHVGASADEVTPLISRAHELSPDQPDTYYIAALTWVVLGDLRNAGQSLSRAVELGYRHNLILNEPDLVALADDPLIGPILAKLSR